MPGVRSDPEQSVEQIGAGVREVERAASADSIIIPFRVEEVQPSCNLAFCVSAAPWLDASTKPIDKHFGELLKAIMDWQKSDGITAEVSAATPLPPSLPRASPTDWVKFEILSVFHGKKYNHTPISEIEFNRSE